MIIEHRTYTLPHGGMDAYLARYRELALPLQMRHLGRLLGFFVSDIGTLNQVLHIWAYDSMADREAAARRWRPIRPGRNSSAAIAGPSWRSRCRSGARRRSVRNGSSPARSCPIPRSPTHCCARCGKAAWPPR